MQIYNEAHFKCMPWKNGGGSTLELICIRESLANEIIFRISSAQINTNGPFSIFLNLDRILLLTMGQGLKLTFKERNLIIDKPKVPISFAGEEEVYCELLNGPCEDFNVMTHRHYGNSIFLIRNLKENDTIQSTSTDTFLYSPIEKILYHLGENECFVSDKEVELYQIDFKRNI